MADNIKDIKKLLKENKLVMGTDETVKGLKLGKIATVYMTANCPENLKADIEHYTKIGGVEIIDLTMTNEELGDLCKRPHFISVMGVLR